MNTSTDGNSKGGVSKREFVAELDVRWRSDRRWQGITRSYTPEDVYRLRGTLPIQYTLARRGAAVETHARRALRRGALGDHGQPGGPGSAGRSQGDLHQRLAGRGRRELRDDDVSRPESVSVRQCAESPGA